MRLSFALLAVMIAGPAFGAEPPSLEATVATAPAALSVTQQIDAYLRSSPALAIVDEAEQGPTAGDDRRAHGEVAIGVGTRGYRSFYARTDLPLGENGRLSIAIEQNRSDAGRFGWRDARGFDDDFGFDRAAPLDRQRCDLEAMTPRRSLDRVGGPHGRCRGPFPER